MVGFFFLSAFLNNLMLTRFNLFSWFFLYLKKEALSKKLPGGSYYSFKNPVEKSTFLQSPKLILCCFGAKFVQSYHLSSLVYDEQI